MLCTCISTDSIRPRNKLEKMKAHDPAGPKRPELEKDLPQNTAPSLFAFLVATGIV
jgi:hypothetical protein